MTLTATANWQDTTVTGIVTFIPNPSGSNVVGSIVNGVLTSSTGAQGVPLPSGPQSWIVEFSDVTKSGVLASIANIAFPAFTTGSVDLIGMSTSGLAVTTLLPPAPPAGIGLPVLLTGSGSVTSVSVTSANGFAGAVTTPNTTPAIAVQTTVTGLLKGNGTAVSAAVADTDYTTPTGTETLTNKTISGSSNTLSNIALSSLAGAAYSTTPTANTLAEWDANVNLGANNLIEGFTSIATAAGTTTLTITSQQIIVFTGTSTQTVKLPTTSVPAGYDNMIINQSTGNVTVQSSNGSTVVVLSGSSSGLASSAIFTSVVATPTTAANWNCQHFGINIANGKILSVSNSLTLAGTDATSFTFPATTGNVIASVTGVGTVTGTPSSTTFLRGDGTWSATPGGGSSTPTANTNSQWDANVNLSANNFINGWTSTATAAGTTTLTITSTGIQRFTGTSTQTVKLPTTSVVAGGQYLVINDSTGAVTVQSSGANTIVVLAGSTSALFTANVATPTTAGNWDFYYYGATVASGKVLTANNSVTLVGTDGTTMTFPTTSATIARTDAGNTFTGHQTIEGVTSAGATGTGNLVFATSPTLTTPVLGTPTSGTLTNCTGLPLAGLASAAYNTTPTASTLAEWDANVNLSSNAFIPNTTSTATAAGTTTLTITSTQVQVFTGTSTQTVKLPTTSVVAGAQYTVINQSTGAVTVQSSGANTVATLAGSTVGVFVSQKATPTAATDWVATVMADGKALTVSNALTLAGVDGKTLTVNNSLTLAGTDSTVMTFPSASDTVVTLAATQTLTNKRVNPRTTSTSGPGATPTVATDSNDLIAFTAIAANITSMTTNLTGTPVTGQKLMLGFKDNGTPATITWGASYKSSGVATLLATTVANKQHWVGLMYDGSSWVCLAVDATGY